MLTEMFDIKEIFKTGWEGFTKNALLMIVLPLGLFVASGILYAFAMFFMMIIPFFIILFPILIIIETLLSLYVIFSMAKASLTILNGETPSWEVLKNDIGAYIKFIAVSIIAGLAVGILSAIVSLLFAVFGANVFTFLLSAILLASIIIIAATFFFPVQFMIAEKKDASIIGSIKKSLYITSKNFIPCLIFIIICIVLNIIGSIPFGLGLIVTFPVSIIAAACVYKKLENSPADNLPAAAPEPAADQI